MAACNFLAPGGGPSALYAGLAQLLGDQKATHGWYLLRSPRYLDVTGDWVSDPTKSKVPLDAGSEPTLQASIELLNLGSFAHLQQHNKFVERWHLSPVPGKLTEYYGNRPLAEKMAEQLKVSGHLYNLLNIRYSPITSRIEITPKKVEIVYRANPSSTVQEEPDGAAELRAQIEAARLKALNEISKPLVDLPFIQDSAVLNSRVQQAVEVEGTGEQLTREIGVGKWQAQIKKEFEIFKKLVNCI